MSKLIQRLGLLCLMLLVNYGVTAAATAGHAAAKSAGGTTYDNAAASVEFLFDGSIDESPKVNPEGFTSIAAFSYGSDFIDVTAADGTVTKAVSSASYNGVNYVAFRAGAGTTSAAGASNALTWTVKPKSGLTFTPTKVSANIRRFGTDAGKVDVIVENAEGVKETLATGLIPARNKAAKDDKTSSDANWRESFSLDIPATLATTGQLKVYVHIYNIGSNKQFGVNDFKLEGTVSGTEQDVTTYAVAAKLNNEDAGTVSIYPAGGSYEAGTELTLTATKNFGYKFVNWTDATGTEVSKDAKFKYTVAGATELTANFEQIKTYALTYGVEGGANDYMVQPTPAPTVIGGKNMYEDGTKVTLAASGNDIVTFTNWSDGQTSSEITFEMNEDKAYTAHYSAVDYIAAWDFYQAGNNGRVADFAAADNDADQLVLRDADGNTYGWLDKCYNNGGYEGRPAGVNWKNDAAIGTYYWQVKVNAANFTDITVKSAMAYNYNAYKTYLVEYSLDGTNFTTVGKIEMPGTKNWTDSEITLPAEANNKSEVYVRWIADKTSSIDGTTSTNDGNAIGAVYILGTEKLVDDGTAPKLVASVPEDGATNASANGKVVLTFDEKVQIAEGTKATLGTQTIEGAVSGKTLTFNYKGLDYATAYKFELPANSVSDLSGNAIAEAITINFTTRTKPAVSKKLYDFIVPTDGTFREAIAAAAKRDDKSVRFRIFVKKGTHVIEPTADAQVSGSDGKSYNSVTTSLSSSNVSIIGEDMESTVLKNDVPYALVTGSYGPACPIEGIGKCDLLQISGSNTYLEDITLRNGTDDATGRNLAVQDKGDKTVYKNVTLYGYQDTWTSNNSSARYYFEDGVIRGRTDYICGKGDAFFNGVTFQNIKGGYIAVPSQPKKYGWIFDNCTIKGETADTDGNYTLGRPWGSGTPIALWLNTIMEAQPSAGGWSDMSGGYPARFAEYNSMTGKGTAIDLSGRRTSWTDGNGVAHANKPILTAEEAAQYTVATVMGGDDEWDPTALTEQASAPTGVTISGSALSWDNNDYVLLWAVVKDGNVVDFTTTPSYTVDDASATWAVRAANEMGGLGDATVAKTGTGISEVATATVATGRAYYNLAGQRVSAAHSGATIMVETFADGSCKATKIVK